MPRPLLLAATLTASLVGQDGGAVGPLAPLAERLEAPAVYARVDAGLARRLHRDLAGSAPVQVLDSLGVAADFSWAVLLGRVCELADGTIELALRDVRRGDGMLRCNLSLIAQERLQALMRDGRILVADEPLAGLDVYRFRDAEAGDGLLLTLVTGQLLAASSRELLGAYLQGPARHARPLVDDPDFQALSRGMRSRSGGLILYGRWIDIGVALARWFVPQAARPLVDLSGFVDAQSALLGVEPCEGEQGEAAGYLSTLLVRRGEGAGDLDGWLALTEQDWLSSLLADAPRGGVATITLALDTRRLRQRGVGSKLDRVYHVVAGGCEQLGLDLEKHVLRALDGAAGVQWVARRAGAARIEPAYVAKARSPRDASRVVAQCADMLQRAGARMVAHQGGGEELRLPGAFGFESVQLGAVGDQLVFSTRPGLVEQVALAAAAADVQYLRWAQTAMRRLERGSRQKVAGVLALDFTRALAEGTEAALRRHLGVLRVSRDYLQVQVFSERPPP